MRFAIPSTARQAAEFVIGRNVELAVQTLADAKDEIADYVSAPFCVLCLAHSQEESMSLPNLVLGTAADRQRHLEEEGPHWLASWNAIWLTTDGEESLEPPEQSDAAFLEASMLVREALESAGDDAPERTMHEIVAFQLNRTTLDLETTDDFAVFVAKDDLDEAALRRHLEAVVPQQVQRVLRAAGHLP